MTTIEAFIKKNYEPVKDKPGYVWFSKINFQIISIEVLAKCLEDALERGLSFEESYNFLKDMGD